MPLSAADLTTGLQQSMARRLYRRSEVKAEITLPAVPGMIDEYVKMCSTLFAGVGRGFSDAELSHLREILAGQLAEAYSVSTGPVELNTIWAIR